MVRALGAHGQSRRSGDVRVTSAFPPIADMEADIDLRRERAKRKPHPATVAWLPLCNTRDNDVFLRWSSFNADDKGRRADLVRAEGRRIRPRPLHARDHG